MEDVVDVSGSGEPADGAEPAASTSPAGGPPESDGGDEGVDLEQVAEQFGAEMLAELDAQPPVKGEGDEGKGKSQAQLDRLEKFIQDNYKGDREAFLHAQYASREEGKRMRERIEELERRVSSPPGPKEPTVDAKKEFDDTRASDPEIKALDQELKIIDDERKGYVGAIAQIAAQAQNLAGELKSLQTQQLKAEPEERASIAVQIADVKSQILALDQDWKLNQSETRRLDSDKRRITREILRAESSIRESMTYEKERAKEAQADRDMTKQQFDASIAFYFTQLGLDPKSEQAKYLQATCRSQLRDHLLSLGEDSYGLDRTQIHAAVGQLVEQAVKVFGIKPKKAAPTKTGPTPRPVVIPRTPAPVIRSGSSGSPSSPQSSLDGVLDNPNLSPKEKAAFVRKRASAVFSAAAQARGRLPS